MRTMRAVVTSRPGDYEVMRLVEEVRALKPGGRVACTQWRARVPGGAPEHCPRRAVRFLKGVSLLSTMSTSRSQLADVIELVRRQRLRPVITERFPLEEAPRVHPLMVERKLSGRVLLVP